MILLSCEGSIECHGDIVADGASAGSESSGFNMNGGGGSGGMIMLLTSNLEGNGSFSFQGGNGGGIGGGGGGGGRLEVNIFGDSASYKFVGDILRYGGKATSSNNMTVNGTVYPGDGSDGIILYPLCPEGRGNNYTTLTFCEECEVNEV